MRFKKYLVYLFGIVILSALQIVYLDYQFTRHTERLFDLNYQFGRQIEELNHRLDGIENRIVMVEKRSYVNSHSLPDLVTFCGDTLDLEDPVIRERLEREFYVLLGSQAQIQLYLKRQRRYLPMISRHLRQAGLPDDLKYLAVHESALLPNIKSRSSAVGIWQFMRSTGRLYKLKINSFVDERRDPEKASAAAMNFLKDLHGTFKNWPLAIAAYNAGMGRVRRNMKTQKTDNYFNLRLPEETERYYFKIVATKIILSDAEKYGFRMNENDYFETTPLKSVELKIVSSRMTLDEIAELCELPVSQFKQANPSFVRDFLPQGVYEIKIPQNHYPDFANNSRQLSKSEFTWGESGGIGGSAD